MLLYKSIQLPVKPSHQFQHNRIQNVKLISVQLSGHNESQGSVCQQHGFKKLGEKRSLSFLLLKETDYQGKKPNTSN